MLDSTIIELLRKINSVETTTKLLHYSENGTWQKREIPIINKEYYYLTFSTKGFTQVLEVNEYKKEDFNIIPFFVNQQTALEDAQSYVKEMSDKYYQTILIENKLLGVTTGYTVECRKPLAYEVQVDFDNNAFNILFDDKISCEIKYVTNAGNTDVTLIYKTDKDWKTKEFYVNKTYYVLVFPSNYIINGIYNNGQELDCKKYNTSNSIYLCFEEPTTCDVSITMPVVGEKEYSCDSKHYISLTLKSNEILKLLNLGKKYQSIECGLTFEYFGRSDLTFETQTLSALLDEKDWLIFKEGYIDFGYNYNNFTSYFRRTILDASINEYQELKLSTFMDGVNRYLNLNSFEECKDFVEGKNTNINELTCGRYDYNIKLNSDIFEFVMDTVLPVNKGAF